LDLLTFKRQMQGRCYLLYVCVQQILDYLLCVYFGFYISLSLFELHFSISFPWKISIWIALFPHLHSALNMYAYYLSSIAID